MPTTLTAPPARIIFVVTRSDTIGGVHQYIISFLILLRSRGFHVSVFCGFSAHSPFVQFLTDNDFSYTVSTHLSNSLNPTRDIKAVCELLRHLRSEQPDLVWSHSSKAGLIARLASLISGCKSLFTVHGWSFSADSKTRLIYILLERMLSAFPSHLLLLSNYDYVTGIRYGLDLRRSRVICNSVPPPNFSLSSYRVSPYPRLVNLLAVARLSPQKDHITVFKALSILSSHLNIVLNVVGDGQLRRHLEMYVSDHGLSSRVLFHGHTDPAPFYESADIFVLSSNWEGLPLTGLEALSHSLPIIVSDVCGCSELVVDGYNGYTFPRNCEVSLAQCILKLALLDPESLSRMRDYSRRVYDNSFNYNDFCRSTMSYVDSILES
jgi:glycosyltransferase involved in cell wall biosynthesis